MRGTPKVNLFLFDRDFPRHTRALTRARAAAGVVVVVVAVFGFVFDIVVLCVFILA